MFKTLNEGFEKLFGGLTEAVEKTDIDNLESALYQKAFALKKQGETNLKAYEVAFQDVIESFFPENSWWEVTDCQIFNSLFTDRDPLITIKCIIDGIKPEFKSVVKESADDDDEAEYRAELEAHIKRIPSYTTDELEAEYAEFRASTEGDDKRIENALVAELSKRYEKKDEGLMDFDDAEDEAEYKAELEKHLLSIPSYTDKELYDEYKEFKHSTMEDDIRIEKALVAEIKKRRGTKNEGYHYGPFRSEKYKRFLKALDGASINEDNIEEYAEKLRVSVEDLYDILDDLTADMFIHGNNETLEYHIPVGAYKQVNEDCKGKKKVKEAYGWADDYWHDIAMADERKKKFAEWVMENDGRLQSAYEWYTNPENSTALGDLVVDYLDDHYTPMEYYKSFEDSGKFGIRDKNTNELLFVTDDARKIDDWIDENDTWSDEDFDIWYKSAKKAIGEIGYYQWSNEENESRKESKHSLKEAKSNDEMKIYMNTWANYNENGADLSKYGINSIADGWMSIEDAIEFAEEHAEDEPFINDTDNVPSAFDVNEYSPVIETLEKLQEFEDSDADMEIIEAIMVATGDDIEEALEIYDDGDYWYIPDVYDDSDLGYAVIDELGGVKEAVGDRINDYIDEEEMRRAYEDDVRNILYDEAKERIADEKDIEEDEVTGDMVEDYIDENLEDYLDSIIDEEISLAEAGEVDLSDYFDYEAYGRDLRLGGDFTMLDNGGAIQVQ